MQLLVRELWQFRNHLQVSQLVDFTYELTDGLKIPHRLLESDGHEVRPAILHRQHTQGERAAPPCVRASKHYRENQKYTGIQKRFRRTDTHPYRTETIQKRQYHASPKPPKQV